MTHRARRLRLACAAALVALLAVASPAAAHADTSALAGKVRALLKDPTLHGPGDRSGVVVVDTQTSETVLAQQGTTAIAPASNMKLVTSAAALDLLGPEFRFRTDLFASTKRSADGVVTGDLYLRGSGDPTLSAGDLRDLALQVKALGITGVTGRVIADASLFDAVRTNPAWRPDIFAQPDQPEISALTLSPDGKHMPGTVGVNITAGSAGKPTKLSLTPGSAKGYIKLVNKTTTGGVGTWPTIRVTRKAGGNTVTVTGRVRVGRPASREHITVSRPDLYAGHVLRAQLKRLGITVSDGVGSGRTPTTGVVRVGASESEPLVGIVTPLLKLSVNGYAEQLVKRLGTVTARQGSWPAGTARVRAWLESNAIPTAGLVLKDGSGLAERNRLTPGATIGVLRHAQAASWWTAFYDALPVAGVRNKAIGGSLHARMIGTAAAGNVHAKTGTLRGVTALSGYATGRNGHLYAFSMLSQYAGASSVGVSDKLAVLLAGWKRQ